jgi:hypothetical protein
MRAVVEHGGKILRCWMAGRDDPRLHQMSLSCRSNDDCLQPQCSGGERRGGSFRQQAELVDQAGASWNQASTWLRWVDALRSSCVESESYDNQAVREG